MFAKEAGRPIAAIEFMEVGLARSQTNDAAMLQEGDEAVRKDRLDTIMQRYGRWIIAGLLAALLAFGGYLFWGHRQDVARGEQAEELIAALEKLATNQPRAATAEWQKIAAEGGPELGRASCRERVCQYV